MKRSMAIPSFLMGALVAALGLLAPVSASASPALEVTVTHSPTTVNHGDEYMTYEVSVRNSGDVPTTAPTNLTVNLDAGMSMDEGKGTDWTCYLTPRTCVYTGTSIAASGDFPKLNIGVNLDEASLPAALNVTMTAFGGGASAAAIGQDPLTLGPQLVFGPVPGSFAARAEDMLGGDYTQAGGHPFKATTAFDFVKKKRKPLVSSGGTYTERPFENARDGAINLPPGFVANPTALPGGCEIGQVVNGTCPERFAIGRAYADLGPTTERVDQQAVVYKIEPEDGYPAALAFRPVTLSGSTIVVRPKIRPQDFTVTALVPRPVQNPELHGVSYFTICSYGAKAEPFEGGWRSPGCKKPTDAGSLATPFITNPTRCNGVPDVISVNLASYQHPGRFDEEGFPDLSDPSWKSSSTTSPALTGCGNLEFNPTFEGRPTTNVADSPTGLDFNLHIPQHGLVDKDANGDPAPEAVAAAHLKDTTVTLPAGMVINPSAANGLQACASKQMGLIQSDHAAPYAIRFDGKPTACPASSKVGSVTIESPLVEQTLEGDIFLGKQFDNPFNSLLAIYIVVRNDEIGFSAKLAGRVSPDPATGQLTAVFAENPQLPFEDLKLKFFAGDRASLRTPATCGKKSTNSVFTSWSEQTPVAERSDDFTIATAPGGGSCAKTAAELPNTPLLTAGTIAPKAGAYSPFVLRLSRDDGSQELKGVNATLPPGLTGRLAGVAYCPESAIARAGARSKPGDGALEQSEPSCPAASLLGSVDISAGAGPVPFHAGGKTYLAGPYKGAPVSMVVITPAVAGPFDLGTVVVRSALYINPVTTQVSVVSDPLPTILEGVPLDVRSIEVRIDRDEFMLNPTNCEPLSLEATAVGMASEAMLSNPFRVGNCSALGFKPQLNLKLSGGTRRDSHPKLRAELKQPAGQANIGGVSVVLPRTQFIDQDRIGNVCTRPQFAAEACPKSSILGNAVAYTPLLDEPLRGKVYFRANGGERELPDMVVDLKGQVPVVLVGYIDSVGKKGSEVSRIRNRFAVVPDAPVTKFVLNLKGGKEGLLVNSTNICAKKFKATVKMKAHNGRARNFSPVIKNDCGKKKNKKAKKSTKSPRTNAPWYTRNFAD